MLELRMAGIGVGWEFGVNLKILHTMVVLPVYVPISRMIEGRLTMECKNHENMRKMMNPICAKDYGLGFKVSKDGSCPECGEDMRNLLDKNGISMV